MITASSPSSPRVDCDTSSIVGDTIDMESRSRWPSSPVASGLREREALALSDPKQRLSCGVGGDGIHVGHEEGGGASSPSSLSCVENDEASSARGHDEEEEDDEEEEGGAEEGEVDEAVDKVCMLLEQGQEAQKKILLGVAEQVRGCMHDTTYLVAVLHQRYLVLLWT